MRPNLKVLFIGSGLDSFSYFCSKSDSASELGLTLGITNIFHVCLCLDPSWYGAGSCSGLD